MKMKAIFKIILLTIVFGAIVNSLSAQCDEKTMYSEKLMSNENGDPINDPLIDVSVMDFEIRNRGFSLGLGYSYDLSAPKPSPKV